jgi:hypothetical protein
VKVGIGLGKEEAGGSSGENPCGTLSLPHFDPLDCP